MGIIVQSNPFNKFYNGNNLKLSCFCKPEPMTHVVQTALRPYWIPNQQNLCGPWEFVGTKFELCVVKLTVLHFQEWGIS